MQPTIGRIVLFHSWRAPASAAAIITGVDLAAGLVNLQVFHDDGTVVREVDVPEFDADEVTLDGAAVAWRKWDLAHDAARLKGEDIPATPDYPQRSWRWPPRVDSAGVGKLEAGLRKMDDALGSLRGGATGISTKTVSEAERDVLNLAVDKVQDGRPLTGAEQDALAADLGGGAQGQDQDGEPNAALDRLGASVESQFDRTDANGS